MSAQARGLVTLLIAVWGAVTGSLSIILAVLRYSKDRVKLFVSPRFSFSFSGVKLPPTASLEVQVVNSGRRPTTLTALLGERRHRGLPLRWREWRVPKPFYLKWDLAKELGEGKLLTIRLGSKDLPPDCGFRDLNRIIVKDHRGRFWRSKTSFGQVRLRQYEDAIEAENQTITGSVSGRVAEIRLYQVGSKYWLRWSWKEGNRTSFADQWSRRRCDALRTLKAVRSSASRYVDGEEAEVHPAKPA